MYYTKCYLSFKIKSCRLALFYPKAWNLCKQVLGKKFLKKNLEIKTLEKSPNFLKFMEKMSLEIKSCVLDSWDFFPKIVWGLPIKSQEIRSHKENKSEEKKNLKKNI